MFRLYHLVWWSLNFSFERAKSLYSCSSLGVGENVGPNREECLSCHCPPFPTVAARQPGLFHLALTVLPLPSLVLSRKFILSFHFQCYYLVQDFITPYLDYHNRLLPGLSVFNVSWLQSVLLSTFQRNFSHYSHPHLSSLAQKLAIAFHCLKPKFSLYSELFLLQ